MARDASTVSCELLGERGHDYFAAAFRCHRCHILVGRLRPLTGILDGDSAVTGVENHENVPRMQMAHALKERLHLNEFAYALFFGIEGNQISVCAGDLPYLIRLGFSVPGE